MDMPYKSRLYPEFATAACPGHTCYSVIPVKGFHSLLPDRGWVAVQGTVCSQQQLSFTKTDLNIVTWEPGAPQAEVTTL